MRLATLSAMLFATALACGCGSSPEPVYYAMAPAHGTPRPGWARVIELRRPALAGYLDRAEIVSSVATYRLRLASNEDWSEPLGDMVGRLMGEDLADRLPGSIVYSELSSLASHPDAVVSLDLQRFDRGADGVVSLVAEITVERMPSHVPVGVRRVELRRRPSGSGTGALVAAMSEMLGELADVVAPYLREGDTRVATAPE
jgi:uncharacterized protein